MSTVPALEVVRIVTDDDRRTGTQFVEAASRAAGRPVLSEQFDAALSGATGASGATFLARRPGRAEPIGLAQLRRDRDIELETVVAPGAAPGGLSVEEALIEQAVRQVADEGGGTLHYWVHGRSPEAPDDPPPGFTLGRELLEMRVALPLPADVVARAEVLPVRSFRPGVDDRAWLEVNNRSFAGHPEQGGWDAATLHEREGHDWFDPDGFLLYEEAGRLAGFCWTKVHLETEPPMGEIYVIGVDPDVKGRGLGRALTVAGLEHLAGRGLTVGMLYVDRANVAAVGLYHSLGFRPVSLERAYVRTVEPSPGP